MECRLGCSASDIANFFANHEPRPQFQATYTKVKTTFQKAGTQRLIAQSVMKPDALFRRKIEHFGFRHRREGSRALPRLQDVGREAPRRVWIATFASVANRLSTLRNRVSSKRFCLLDCVDGDDSCEHYAECPVVGSFINRHVL